MLQYAFVIKNFSPVYCKAKILHSKYGKISCFYSKNHQAKLLTTGSLIVCDVEPFYNGYTFLHLDIIYSLTGHDLEKLEFMHQMMLICLKLLPDDVPVEEIFNFLFDIYKKNNSVTSHNKKLILLRLFFLSEIFEQNVQLYKLAMQDPFNSSVTDVKLVEKYLEIGFNKLFQQKNLGI